MKHPRQRIVYVLVLTVAALGSAALRAERKPLVSDAEPRVLLGRNLDDGRTLLITEEAIPDVFPRVNGVVVPPDPARPIYRCTVLIMSEDGKAAAVAWSSLGRIEGFDGRVKPFDARVFGDVVVLAYLEANDVCAQVIRRARDGSFTPMPGGDPTLWREVAGGPQTVAAHIEGQVEDGSLCVTLDEQKYGKQWPVCFRLVARDGRDQWVRTDPAATRPATRPLESPLGAARQ